MPIRLISLLVLACATIAQTNPQQASQQAAEAGRKFNEERLAQKPGSPIPLSPLEITEMDLIKARMQVLQEQAENLRLRVCIRADAAKECGAFDPQGRPYVNRILAPKP